MGFFFGVLAFWVLYGVAFVFAAVEQFFPAIIASAFMPTPAL